MLVSPHEVDLSSDTEAVFNLTHEGKAHDKPSYEREAGSEMIRQTQKLEDGEALYEIRASLDRCRCTYSKRLMTSPVKLLDRRYCDQTSLDLDLHSPPTEFSIDLAFKSEITQLTRSALKSIGRYLELREVPQDILELTAECLSVLSIEADMDYFLRVFEAVEGENVKSLISKLRVPTKWVSCLMEQFADKPYLQATVIALGRKSLADAVDLSEDVMALCSDLQFMQIYEALVPHMHTQQADYDLDQFKLIEVCLRLKSGDSKGARELAKELEKNPSLNEKLLELHGQAGWSDDKSAYLTEHFKKTLAQAKKEDPSSKTIDLLATLYQMVNELRSNSARETADDNGLKAELLKSEEEFLSKLEQITSALLELAKSPLGKSFDWDKWYQNNFEALLSDEARRDATEASTKKTDTQASQVSVKDTKSLPQASSAVRSVAKPPQPKPNSPSEDEPKPQVTISKYNQSNHSIEVTNLTSRHQKSLRLFCPKLKYCSNSFELMPGASTEHPLQFDVASALETYHSLIVNVVDHAEQPISDEFELVQTDAGKTQDGVRITGKFNDRGVFVISLKSKLDKAVTGKLYFEEKNLWLEEQVELEANGEKQLAFEPAMPNTQWTVSFIDNSGVKFGCVRFDFSQ
jgi:hypothetical protein